LELELSQKEQELGNLKTDLEKAGETKKELSIKEDKIAEMEVHM